MGVGMKLGAMGDNLLLRLKVVRAKYKGDVCNDYFICMPSFLTLKNPQVSDIRPLIMGLL